MDKPIRFGPASKKQRMVLVDNTTDVILTGGGAGGGKSATCLMKNLDGVEDPDFRCTIFRRTNPELTRQGGLIDESKQFYTPFNGVYKIQAKTWVFPSGAQIQFAAFPDESAKGGWQGSQLGRILIDEVGDKWSEDSVIFLLSRLRPSLSKTETGKTGIHPQLIMTCNPDSDSFLYDWLKDWALDPDTGVAYDGIEKRVRWFVNLSGKMYWGDDPDELFNTVGKPLGMIDARGLDAKALNKLSQADKDKLFFSKSFRFIPATVYDNPYLLPPRNNSYLANLLAQSPQAQLKYLKGSWLKVGQSTGYFKREWVNYVDMVPDGIVGRVRAYDLASTPENPDGSINRLGDFTASVMMSKDRHGNFYIEDVERIQKHSGKVLEHIIETAYRDGIDDCKVVIPRDSGQGGVAYYNYMVRELACNGIPSTADKISGHLSKLNKTLPFCNMAQTGKVYIVKGAWDVDSFFSEMENFIAGNRNQKDDQWDAVGSAFNALARQVQLPAFSLPDYSKLSPTAGIL